MTEKTRQLQLTRRRQIRQLSAVIIAGVVLFLAPLLVRYWLYGVRTPVYQPPAQNALARAHTPEATATAWALDRAITNSAPALPQGAVVIDFAHFNQVDPRGLQPLAAALARRGHATRVWLSDIDPFAIASVSETPDQSEELAAQLRDASALVVISPFLLWSAQEIAVVERFVADGGRLLLISDPDVPGDAAVYTNLLAEPFGIVFNDDYLYDTVRNDRNYTHFFQDDFLDEAIALDGLQIAFYGGRSISGDVTAQARSAETTLSSRRTGVNGFTTIAIGGDRGWNTAGQVMALSDFDVLTEPNVVRHDNQQLVEFVADFLARARRTPTLDDFPAFLGSEVTLMIGVESGLNADTLLTGAQLQRRLEETGRTLTLAGAPRVPTPAPSADATLQEDALDEADASIPPALSYTAPATATANLLPPVVLVLPTTPVTPAITPAQSAASITPTPSIASTITDNTAIASATARPSPSPSPTATVLYVSLPDDLILLADYDYANTNTRLLLDAGVELVTEFAIPTPGATALPHATAASTATPTATTEPLLLPLDETPPTLLPELPEDTTPPPITPPSQATTPQPVQVQATITPTAAADTTPTTAPTAAATDEATTPDGRPDSKPQPSHTPGNADTATVAPTIAPTLGVTPTATVIVTATASVTATADATATRTPTPTPTPTATPTPVEVTWLVSEDGMRLLADQTIMLLRESSTRGRQPSGSIVVLGSTARAIKAGVDRLLANDLSDCILGENLSWCPLAPLPAVTATPRSQTSGATPAAATPTAATPGAPRPDATTTVEPEQDPEPTPAIPPDPLTGGVLIVDDDVAAVEGEFSEAEAYWNVLRGQGINADFRTITESGIPTVGDLEFYTWVIWSNGGYANGQIDVGYLDAIFSYLNLGGRITISSRVPFFAMGVEPPAPLRDVVVVPNDIGLVDNLPTEPVTLEADNPSVAPLAAGDGADGFTVSLARGPASDSPEQPALVSGTDEGEAEAKGARLIVVGMSLIWLPEPFADQLVANMAAWMLE